MAEWLKAHAWKACGARALAGSNPVLSAMKRLPVFAGCLFILLPKTEFELSRDCGKSKTTNSNKKSPQGCTYADLVQVEAYSVESGRGQFGTMSSQYSCKTFWKRFYVSFVKFKIVLTGILFLLVLLGLIAYYLTAK